MREDDKIAIGILTTPGSRHDFRRLFRENESLGNLLFVFTPKDISFKKRKIKGEYMEPDGRWKRKKFEWPNVVMDKHFNSPNRLYHHIRKNSLLPFTDHLLPGKWDIHNLIKKDSRLRNYLPKTRIFSKHTFKKMLSKYPILYAKPFEGTWGNGIIKIERHSKHGYLVIGRKDGKKIVRTKLSENEVISWVERWVGRTPFVIQQGLNLKLLDQCVSDLRVLIQKNGLGRWHITGEGMRIGAAESPTSNLHGGGSAKEVWSFLQPIFGEKKVKQLLKECHNISYMIADVIEKAYGRMMELGLDFGIDTRGKLWIIEVNDMPGRQIFKKMKRKDLYKEANRLPLLYARYLASKQTVPSESDRVQHD